MTRDRFRQLVEAAFGLIPPEFRAALQNVAIVVEDEPRPEHFVDLDLDPDDTLLGLYQGIPLTERQWAQGNTLPDKITLFQGPIEDISETEDDVVVEVGETLIHEIGHYFGLSEDEIQHIEDEYWRRLDEGDDSEATS